MNPYTDREILENLPIDQLTNLRDIVVIYNQSDLNCELDEIIALYNYIPKVSNKKFAISAIHFNLDNRNVYLATDPNDTRLISYKGINILCERHDIEFSNQTLGVSSKS